MVIAPAHHRRIAAGILSYGQDMDCETSPFQCNLGYQVPRRKRGDYIGKARLEEVRAQIDAGEAPFKLGMVGLAFGGEPVTDYANDFWLVKREDLDEAVGYVTSPWFSPELNTNIALAYVPWKGRELGTRYGITLPDEYAGDAVGNTVSARVVEVPFRPSVNPNVREVVHGRGKDHAD